MFTRFNYPNVLRDRQDGQMARVDRQAPDGTNAFGQLSLISREGPELILTWTLRIGCVIPRHRILRISVRTAHAKRAASERNKMYGRIRLGFLFEKRSLPTTKPATGTCQLPSLECSFDDLIVPAATKTASLNMNFSFGS